MRYIKIFENYSNIEDIEDYFIELSDHHNDNLPINVEVTDHNISKKIKGYKISIIYDMYDQVYVDRIVNTAIKRLSSDYNVHYNQVSKQGNGYTRKEIPVHSNGTTATIHDPKWKRTITISPKSINESLKDSELDIIEDFLDMTEYNKELTITGHYKHTFDFFTKNIIGDSSKFKQELLYGNITNADIMRSNCESIVNCIVALIKFTNNDAYWLDGRLIISKTFLRSIFKRLILLCPNVVIFYKIISLGSESSRSEVFEFVFFIDPTK